MSSYRYEVQRANLRARLLPDAKKGKIRQENTLIADLFDLYPDMKFWEKVTPTFPIETFADLFTPKGRAFLKRSYAAFHFTPPEPPARYQLSPEKVGEDRSYTKPIRTVRQFLNG